MTYNQRDIVLIPIPFTDLSSHKKRPVIIISNDYYNKTNPDIVVVALTSNLIFENKYTIDIDNHSLESGELPTKSRIRCDKIYTLSRNIVLKKFCKVNNETFKLIKDKICALIDTDNEILF
ncbi:MAG: type II toxin-antitoxin system PemK/MazF family toxin [candidate division KSB1 bacterium]|nr:type II toxin-antitoxin system PemK/MazF family toxin [candidate division KSB1 bacterium]MDZ7339731.1 type II toxin-antitoxin system PemK/MazF family toxin [candidate division KSB1 bacterium]